jgi:NAD-dependent deacetylase
MTGAALVKIPVELINLLHTAHSVTVLSGAGTSAESGIPTFRDSQTGLWAKYNPHDLATPEAFAKNPRLVMDWYRWRRKLIAQASPNPGHLALAALEKQFQQFSLVTQNVDGLHQTAGSRSVIELHGSIQKLRCSNASCSYKTDTWPIEDLPTCPQCTALLRPDIVWFGEMLPQSVISDALQSSQTCDIFFSIGTSGVVEPAASLPYEALRSGAVVVEINPQPTPLSVYTKFSFQFTAGEFLPALVETIGGSE